MRRSTRWGAVVGLVCGAEVVVLALLGGAGLAAVFRPTVLGAIGVMVVAGVGLAVVTSRSRSDGPDPVDT